MKSRLKWASVRSGHQAAVEICHRQTLEANRQVSHRSPRCTGRIDFGLDWIRHRQFQKSTAKVFITQPQRLTFDSMSPSQYMVEVARGRLSLDFAAPPNACLARGRVTNDRELAKLRPI